MKTQLSLAVVILAFAATTASAATSSGTLTVTGTVESSISLTVESAGGTTSGTGTAAATSALGSISKYGSAPTYFTLARGASDWTISLRTTWQKLYAGLFGDYQRDAATVDLVFREDPALAQAFAALGLEVQSPEDLARVLRDNPALAQLGYLEGATVNLHPWRLLTG